MIEITPSVLATNTTELANIAEKLKNYEGPLHIDIADGIFVPNTTVGAEEILASVPSHIFDVHLMVQKPEEVVPLWLNIPGVFRIVFHIEAATNPSSIIQMIKGQNKEALIAINPGTSTDSLAAVADLADGVHFMTVKPGFYASPFEPGVVEEIKKFHALKPNIKIQVDGDVNRDTIGLLAEAGATRFVVGHDLIKSEDVNKEIAELQAAV